MNELGKWSPCRSETSHYVLELPPRMGCPTESNQMRIFHVRIAAIGFPPKHDMFRTFSAWTSEGPADNHPAYSGKEARFFQRRVWATPLHSTWIDLSGSVSSVGHLSDIGQAASGPSDEGSGRPLFPRSEHRMVWGRILWKEGGHMVVNHWVLSRSAPDRMPVYCTAVRLRPRRWEKNARRSVLLYTRA